MKKLILTALAKLGLSILSRARPDLKLITETGEKVVDVLANKEKS